MFESHLFARCTAHHAVLYWDKPAAAGARAEYTVYLNNEPVGTTHRTHYTLDKLEPQTEYRVDVVFENQPVGACMLRAPPKTPPPCSGPSMPAAPGMRSTCPPAPT